MSDEWGKSDDYDPWAVPEPPPESELPGGKPPKDKKPQRDKKPQNEKKSSREKKSAKADVVPGDAWGTADAYDPCAIPVEKPEQEASAKPPREKKPPADRKLPAERKLPRERRPPAEKKLAAGDATSVGDAPTTPVVDTSTSSTQCDTSNEKRKSQAYHNPERVLTGGAQRDKLSEEELTERITRMREQNEKIKQRRMDIIADEDAFKKTQEFERIKQEKIRKEQEHVDRTREQNARRKMDNVSSREWDEGKPSGDWKQARKQMQDSSTLLSAESSNRGRGGTSNRGRGRGRDEGTPAFPGSETV